MWQGVLQPRRGPGTHVLLQAELLLTQHRGADFGLGEVLEAAGALEGELGQTERREGFSLHTTPRPSSHPPLRQPGPSGCSGLPRVMPVLEEFFGWRSLTLPAPAPKSRRVL